MFLFFAHMSIFASRPFFIIKSCKLSRLVKALLLTTNKTPLIEKREPHNYYKILIHDWRKVG